VSVVGCGEVTPTPQQPAPSQPPQLPSPSPGPPTDTPPSQPPTPQPPPTAPPTPMPMPCPTPELEDWTAVASRLYFEGASSFFGLDQSQRVFVKQTWALRTLREAQYPSHSYTQLTASPGFLSAHYQTSGAPSWAVTWVEQILTDQPSKPTYPFNEPQGTVLHWISPQNWPARYEDGTIVTFSSDAVPGCGGVQCQLPDIRLVEWARNLSADREEQFISFLNEYSTTQCYWIGVYFVKEDNWNTVHHGAPSMPTFNCQEPHSCPATG